MAEVSLPSAWIADSIPERNASLNECFAHVLGQVMTGLLSPEEAVAEWARACDQEARHIYNISQDYDYPSRVQYEDEMHELRDECDTWSLIAHMFTREDTGSGPCPVMLDLAETPGCGKMSSLMQQCLGLTSSHNDLRRVAQVVVWLEDLSLRQVLHSSVGQLADSLNEFGTSAGYTRQECIQHLRASAHPAELSSQDPDARTWQTGVAGADHRCVTEDEQLLSAVYKLLRSGAEPLAMNLCTKAACGWRAATICAAGWGLLPLARKGQGRPNRADKSKKVEVVADVLACEDEADELASGSITAACTRRYRWRAACAAAAAAASLGPGTRSADAVAAGYEQAIYGILAGSEEDCQDVSTTWQDQLWVRGRAVLQSEPERRLLEGAQAHAPRTPRPPQKLRPWRRNVLVDIPADRLDAPTAANKGSVVDQIMVLLNEIEAAEGDSGRLHHSVQRLLVKAAFDPMMPAQPTEHPLRLILQKLLAVGDLPTGSVSTTNHRIRFATHLGLALVSLGAMPGSPGVVDRLWNTFSDSLPGWLLEAVNHMIDAYISTLTNSLEPASRELLPQYICLLRPSLTNVTLRRCFMALMPAAPVHEHLHAQAATEALIQLQTSQVSGMIVAQPPASGCFASVLSPQAWHESAIFLETLLNWFNMWHQDAADTSVPDMPHLPRTTVRFDAVLCETVRAAVHSNAVSNIDRVATVRWLLLPFQMRKDMLEPFLGGSGANAEACWACTVQALFVAVDICRQSALKGVAQQYAAFSLLQHMCGDTYTCHVPFGAEQAKDEITEPAVPRTLFEAVSARCELQEHGEETQLLIALQRAVHELEEWQEALSAMDQLARFSRAAAVAANDVFVEASMAEAVAAAAAVGSRELLQGECYIPTELTGDVGLEMCVCAQRSASGGAQAPRDVWGSSTAVDPAAGMPRSDAHALASKISQVLNARVNSATSWQARGVGSALPDAVEIQCVVDPLHSALEAEDEELLAAVRIRVAISGVHIMAAISAGHGSDCLSSTVACCMDIVTTSVADLLQYVSCHEPRPAVTGPCRYCCYCHDVRQVRSVVL
eukprot:jgi/Ulvmu1/5888/UM026_0009.1